MSKKKKETKKKAMPAAPKASAPVESTFELPGTVKEKDLRRLFSKYFIRMKKKHSLDPSMEEILWAHLKAKGLNKPEKFDEGLKDFGILL